MEILIRPTNDLIKKYSQTESNHRLSPHMHAINIDIRAMLYQLSYASGYDGYKIPTNCVPQLGIEPRTYRLQSGCSTTELSRQIVSRIHFININKVAVCILLYSFI